MVISMGLISNFVDFVSISPGTTSPRTQNNKEGPVFLQAGQATLPVFSVLSTSQKPAGKCWATYCPQSSQGCHVLPSLFGCYSPTVLEVCFRRKGNTKVLCAHQLGSNFCLKDGISPACYVANYQWWDRNRVFAVLLEL